MTQIHIHQLNHRAHIRGAATTSLRARIDSALTSLLEDGLETALLHAGVDSEEEICIRRLHTRAHLRLARSDQQLATDLSAAWIEDLRATLDRGGAEVVRYRSRLHALLDIGLRVTAHDESHVWAWRQLNLWPRDTQVTTPQAATALAQVLIDNPATIIGVCSELARHRRLGSWMAKIPVALLRTLANAALRAATSTYRLPLAMADAVVDDDGKLASAPDAIRQVMDVSPLRQDLVAIVAADNADAVAVLMLLAAEPSMLNSTRASAIVGLAATALIEDQRTAEWQNGNDQYDQESIAPRHAVNGNGPRAEQRQLDAIDSAFEEGAITAIRSDRRSLSIASAFERAASADIDAKLRDVRSDLVQNKNVKDTQSPVSLRQQAHTEWGGLLYLLWLIESSGVLAAAESAPLAGRGLRWVLRQLALQLLPLRADDAIVNAFCGLPLLSQAAQESAASEIEAPLIGQLANDLVSALRTRLDDAATSDERLLHSLCRRQADICFDPGWIELRFPLDEISTSIRRSGLDRNPDWVPWLGIVVRFSYV